MKSTTNALNAERKAILRLTLFVWLIFLTLWLFSKITHLGFQHDVVGLSWGPAGTPITFLQVILVGIISLVLATGWGWIGRRFDRNAAVLYTIRDALIFIVLWGLAVLLWSREPMSPTHFSPPPMPPNHETYPHSDALLFDRSSYHLLYGAGFADRLVRRPVYVGMLALFHGVVGGNYDDTMFLQILLLALIPGLVFLFTSKLSNPLAGMIAGGSIVLREKNSIALSGEIVTSNAKLMMSDMIATLGVVVVLYLAVRWLFTEKPRGLEFVIIGAGLGLTALVRAQVLVLLVPLLLFIFLTRKHLGQTAKFSLFLVAGIVVVMAPWTWRNWNLTGTFVLDDRGEERLLARNYSLSPLSMPDPLPGETDEEFSARLKADIASFIISHPGEVGHFVTNHFVRNLVTSAVYVAPAYSSASPEEIIQHLPFWDDWNGDLTRNSALALFLNLGLIALGIAAARTKNTWMGIFPLVAFATYSLGNALVRSSGWRFNQPADWIIVVYYSVALAYLPSMIRVFFNKTIPNEAHAERKNGIEPVLPQVLILSAFVLLGASVPIAERLVPARGFDGVTDQAKAKLVSENIATADEIEVFLVQEDAVWLTGIALYPRYVQPNSRFKPLEELNEDRYLHFWMIDEDDRQVVLPMQNLPENIPHTATVTVMGCREAGYISVAAIIVHEPATQILVRAPETSFTCPLTELP